MADLSDEMLHWSRGVVTSAEADRVDLQNALVRNDNGMFTSVANGVAQIRKRFGMTTVNRTPVNNSSGAGPSVVFGTPYKYVSGSTTRYTAIVTGTGNVHFFTDDGVSDALTPSASFASALTTASVAGDAAEMNNRLFLLDQQGGKAAFLGAVKTAWGVPVPTGLALSDPGSAGAMTGSYDVLVTEWDDQIKAESDITATASITGLSSDQLRVTVNAVGVSLTHRHFRVYIRKTASPNLGGAFVRVLAGSGYVGGTVMGFPLFSAGATVTTDINVSDATIVAGVLSPPPGGAHGLPPATAKYAAVFQRRLFLADDSNVYWSELDKPDAFNPLNVEPVSSPRGGSVVAIMPMANGRGMHILTETGRHSIVGGADTRSWTIDVEDPELGAVNRGSVIGHRRMIGAWDADQGPVLLAPDGTVAYIGTDFIRDTIKASALSPANYHLWLGAGLDGRMVFGVVDIGQTRVQRLLVFNLEMGAWESTNWDPMDAASLFVSYDSSGNGYVYLGNYNGQIFRLLKGGTDGVASGTTSGTFTPGATSVSTITDATATFDTTGAGLRQRRVRVLDSSGQVLETGARVHVTSNTSTVLTLSGSISGLAVGTAYTYVIAGPDFLFETYWGNMRLPFTDKRFDLLYSELRADEGVNNVAIRMNFAWDPSRVHTASSVDLATSLWDVSEWDTTNWDGFAIITRRIPILRRGFNYRIQLRNPYPNQGFTVLKLAVLARRLSDRYAGNA